METRNRHIYAPYMFQTSEGVFELFLDNDADKIMRMNWQHALPLYIFAEAGRYDAHFPERLFARDASMN